jgi:hypothetical protein
MRVPEVRFGSDHRVIYPWQYRFRIVAFLVAFLLVLPFLVLADAIARVVLPRRIRDRYWFPRPRPPEVCPACRAPMSIRLFRIPISSDRRKPGETPPVVDIYAGRCPGCGRTSQWHGLGMVVVRIAHPIYHFEELERYSDPEGDLRLTWRSSGPAGAGR